MRILDVFKKRKYPDDETLIMLKASFANVKRDTAMLFQWTNYFNQKLQQYEQEFYRLNIELSSIPKTKESLREIIDSYYQNLGILDKLKNVEQRIDNLCLQKSINPQNEDTKAIMQRIDGIEQKRQTIKHKIIEHIAKKSKEHVKSITLSLIRRYEKISAQQLRNIVVEEQALCSRSSFYRILEEIENDDSVGVLKERKEKHYLSKISKHS